MTVRIGLIGAGFIGHTHLEAAALSPEVEIVGYVDPTAEENDAGLADLPGYQSVDDLIAHEHPAGVLVATPDRFHVPLAKHCLAAGVAVLLEKPAATSLTECLDLAATPGAAERLLVAHQRRHHPAAQAAKRLIDDQTLGRLLALSGVYAVRKEDEYFVSRPRGIGLVNLIHDLDLHQFLCGRIESVSAEVSHRGRAAAEEDTIALVMTFASGAIGTMLATDSAPSPWGWDQATKDLPAFPHHKAGTTCSLIGREGSLTVPDLRLYRHRAGESWHQPLVSEQIVVPARNAYIDQLSHFAAVCIGETAPICGIDDALATQAALDAVFLSAAEGRRVQTADLVG